MELKGKVSYALLMLLFLSVFVWQENVLANTDDSNWWPKQPVPEGIVKAENGDSHGENALLASLAGLVGKAQKNGEMDELIWIESDDSYPKWYSMLVDRLDIEERGEYDVWQLLERYENKGLIEGYILYNPEQNSEVEDGLDYSYNIAASYAGVKDAIIIDEKLEPKIKELGYDLILDAREVSRDEYFEDLKGKVSRDLILTLSPSLHNNIDYAIANKALITYNTDDVTRQMMDWINPISPVMGWNDGDEHVFTELVTEYGLFNTASDYTNNLLALSAGSGEAEFRKLDTVNPKDIDFSKDGDFHSVVMSDGDNMQWTIGSFMDSEQYWGNASHGEYPVGFTSCPINLSWTAPDVLDEMGKTQPAQTTVIEYGGGYQYPDLFARQKENREEIQRNFARKVSENMKRSGAKVFGFICMDVDSEEAIEAYEIYAEEIENLTGMFAVQYAPYHGGGGEIHWVENKEGIEIPVVTARYSLWKDLGTERGGNVRKIANVINEDVEKEENAMDWTVVHAWSNFKNPDNPDETASGLDPVKWTLQQLDDDIHVVSPEELLWRIRMSHDAEQTKKVISNYK